MKAICTEEKWKCYALPQRRIHRAKQKVDMQETLAIDGLRGKSVHSCFETDSTEEGFGVEGVGFEETE